MLSFVVAALLAASACVHAKVYLKEDFNDPGWSSRWTVPTEWKSESEMGEWKHTAGKWYADEDDLGIQTSPDARFHGLSAPLKEDLYQEDKDLVVQYTVKNEQKLDCGGAYIKLLPDMDQASFGGDTPYSIMFGPDICGSATKKVHVIFNYPPKDENLEMKDTIKAETNELSHLYTLKVSPDNTFEVFVDKESVKSGNLKDQWDFLEPETIKDPEAKKPEDWVDEKRIPDPDDVKPEGYDDIPEEIPDPEAEKPDDWDDEEDGEWEPPMIPNPEYKGKWKPKMIENPDYKGPWKHPKIPNPNYKDDDKVYLRCNPCSYVGFELWQVKSGTIFDDILITDSLEEAWDHADETFFAKKDGEKAMYDKIEAKKRAEEEAARKKAEEEMDDDELGLDDEEDYEDDHSDEL